MPVQSTMRVSARACTAPLPPRSPRLGVFPWPTFPLLTVPRQGRAAPAGLGLVRLAEEARLQQAVWSSAADSRPLGDLAALPIPAFLHFEVYLYFMCK